VLGLIYLPVLGPLVGWTLAVQDVLRGYANALELKWTRLLVALVVADALVVASGIWAVSHREELEKAKPVRIGVRFDASVPKGEPRIHEVLADSPASRAGFRAGDRIESIDQVPIASAEDVVRELSRVTAGRSVHFDVRRDGSMVGIDVVPEPATDVAEKIGLFEPQGAREPIPWVETLLPYLPVVVLAALAFLWSRRGSRPPVKVWRVFALAIGGSMAASLAASLLVERIAGGSTFGGMLVAMLVQMIAMLSLSLAGLAWVGRDVPPPPDPLPPQSSGRAALQGLFYMITGYPRVAILLAMADQLFFGGKGMGVQVLEQLAAQRLGVLGTCLFVFDVVLLGPLAEELLFRGVLLPRLAAQFGSAAGIVLSSMLFMLIHPRYGPFMPMVFFYGYVFGWARLRSGSIVPCYVLHVAVNAFVSALMLLK
jgi:membrane protease YdiL (CAAX protease family)